MGETQRQVGACSGSGDGSRTSGNTYERVALREQLTAPDAGEQAVLILRDLDPA